MEVQKDFRELLELFNTHKVEYLIVGGYALAFHGVPRYTGDIDIFVKPDTENALRILKALDEFGFGSLDLKEEDFRSPNKVVQLGYPPVRIDIMTSISGLSWDEAYEELDKGKYGNVPVYYIGLNHYILNKRASGRKKDIADLEALGEE
jgi:predicted nucleotidyltransferase